MALEQKLSLKLSQRLVMTPSLQQAIKLLQMTRLELEGVVSQELEQNPVLEEVENAEEEDEEGESPSAVEPESAAATVENERAELAAERRKHEEAAFEAYLEESWNDDGASYGDSEDREAPPLENTLTREPDLYDHLLWQIHMSDLPPRQREIAELIV